MRNAPLDARGKHARTCTIGGYWWGWVRRHNGLRDYGAVSWKACSGSQALTEQRVPEWDRQVPHGWEGTVPEEDMLDITSDPQSGLPLQVDVTVTIACPSDLGTLRRRARRNGTGAADAAAAKLCRYNLAERGNRGLCLALRGGSRQDWFLSAAR